MTKLSEEQIDAFRNEHKRIAVVDYQGYEIVLRRPKDGEYKRFRSLSVDEKKRLQALEDLTRALIVYPQPEAVAGIQEEFVAFYESMGAHALELAGLVQSEARK